MGKLVLESLELKNPSWGGATGAVGKKLTLSVEGTVAGAQWVEFRIMDAKTLVAAIDGKPGEKSVEWTPLNLPGNDTGETKLKFQARLREKPGPSNGHESVLSMVESPEFTLQGYSLKIENVDEAFVPKREQLQVKYKITDAGGAATKGRYVIWGERYPKDEYIYFEEFDAVVGEKTWDSWDGKANNGWLKDKYITPEFSPYRVQIVIGPDADTVKEPFEKGLGKAAIAEHLTAVKFQTILVRLAANLPGAVTNLLKPDQTLVVEPRTSKGAYGQKGRLALEKETKLDANWDGAGEGLAAAKDRPGLGRLRVENLRHNHKDDALNQDWSTTGNPPNLNGKTNLHRVGDAYTKGGSTKYAIDEPLYKRLEIPLEIEARLRSRTPDEEAKKDGVFEKEAIGPVRYDMVVQDPYLEWMHKPTGGPVTLYNEARETFKKAAWKVKRGEHNAPHSSANKPVITYWQQRFEITSHGQEELGDTEEEFVKEKKELTVYLNGNKLIPDEDATKDNSKRIKKDYAEISTKKIKFRKGLTRAKDEVWIVREPHSGLSHPAVAGWAQYPPGDNCHKHYGGIRGKEPEAGLLFTLRDDYSGTLAGQFAYKGLNSIYMDPEKVDLAKRERVETEAILASGNQQGLAGVIFSPSVIAGDKYIVEARVRECPYARELGYAGSRPVTWNTVGKTGTMTVWRLLTLKESWRMPSPQASGGLSAGVGEDDPAAVGRAHPASGRKMNFLGLNQAAEKGFNEWVALKSDGNIAGPDQEAHQNVNLDTYRGFFNGKIGTDAGYYNIASAAKVTNEFVRWDHYRVELPPGIPNGTSPGNAVRRGAASAKINAVVKGGDSKLVGQAVNTAITNWNSGHGGPAGADAPPGGTAIPISTRTADEYLAWAKKNCKDLANEFMDTLIPQDNAPKAMRVLRWPKLFWSEIWYDGTYGNMKYKSLGIGGYCRGSGQAFFFSIQGQATTFEHEMGHSLHLAHFAAASETNFAWKHHDHSYLNCLMGYNKGDFKVPLKTGATGSAIQVSTDPRSHLCPKCLLKIRGWKEDVIPCNWDHPDIF